MMTKDEALKMVIDYEIELPERVINACKEALEQPAQEPVGFVVTGKLGDNCSFRSTTVRKGDKVYTHPHQEFHAWNSLTDDEIVEFACEYGLGTDMPKSEEYPLGILWYDGNRMEFAHAIEQALKEKNT